MKTRPVIASLALLFVMQCVNQSPTKVHVEFSGVACSACHGADSASVMASGLHQVHGTPAVYGGSGCNDCHPDNNKSHATINGIVKMKDSTTLASTTVCNQCHGNGATRAKTYWTKPIGTWLSDGGFCESCHDGSSIVKSRPAPNVMARYIASGHGNSTGFVQTKHGKPGPGYGCMTCHDPSGTGHFDGVTGSQRLRIDNSASGLCLDCHAAGQTAPGLLGVNAFSKATKHSTSVTGHYSYNYECDACHDPHGTSNLAMVRTAIDGGLGAGPVSFTFTDSTTFDPSHKDALSNLIVVNGVCNVCHAPGRPPHNNTADSGNHYYGSACWSCHLHTVSFDTVGFLTYILIAPNPAQLNVHGSLQLTVQGITNLNGTIDFTTRPLWSSSNPAIATVNALGNLNGIAAGTAVVYSRYSGFVDSAVVQVNP